MGDGYFCCTRGNARQEPIKKYIESQGEMRQFIPEAEDIGVFLLPFYKEMQKPLEPLIVSRTGYREAAYRAIKDAILSGFLKQGRPLIEDEIAARLQVSRTPVREALIILQHEGLIAPRSGRGFHVRQLTREEFVTIFVANEAIEPFLVRRAALVATEAHLRGIENALAESKLYTLSGDLAGMLRTGRDFHRAVGIASGNEPLTQFIVSNEERIDMYLLSCGRIFDTSTWNPSNQEHERIFNAIVQRDPESAARLVAYHSQSVRERLAPLFSEDKSEKVLIEREESSSR